MRAGLPLPAGIDSISVASRSGGASSARARRRGSACASRRSSASALLYQRDSSGRPGSRAKSAPRPSGMLRKREAGVLELAVELAVASRSGSARSPAVGLVEAAARQVDLGVRSDAREDAGEPGPEQTQLEVLDAERDPDLFLPGQRASHQLEAAGVPASCWCGWCRARARQKVSPAAAITWAAQCACSRAPRSSRGATCPSGSQPMVRSESWAAPNRYGPNTCLANPWCARRDGVVSDRAILARRPRNFHRRVRHHRPRDRRRRSSRHHPRFRRRHLRPADRLRANPRLRRRSRASALRPIARRPVHEPGTAAALRGRADSLAATTADGTASRCDPRAPASAAGGPCVPSEAGGPVAPSAEPAPRAPDAAVPAAGTRGLRRSPGSARCEADACSRRPELSPRSGRARSARCAGGSGRATLRSGRAARCRSARSGEAPRARSAWSRVGALLCHPRPEGAAVRDRSARGPLSRASSRAAGGDACRSRLALSEARHGPCDAALAVTLGAEGLAPRHLNASDLARRLDQASRGQAVRSAGLGARAAIASPAVAHAAARVEPLHPVEPGLARRHHRALAVFARRAPRRARVRHQAAAVRAHARIAAQRAELTPLIVANPREARAVPVLPAAAEAIAIHRYDRIADARVPVDVDLVARYTPSCDGTRRCSRRAARPSRPSAGSRGSAPAPTRGSAARPSRARPSRRRGHRT